MSNSDQAETRHMAPETSQHRYDKTEVGGSASLIQGNVHIATANFACGHAPRTLNQQLLGVKRGWDEDHNEEAEPCECSRKRRRIQEYFLEQPPQDLLNPFRQFSLKRATKRIREDDVREHCSNYSSQDLSICAGVASGDPWVPS